MLLPRASFISFNRTILVKLPDNSNICVIAESAPMLALSLPTVFSCLLACLVTFIEARQDGSGNRNGGK